MSMQTYPIKEYGLLLYYEDLEELDISENELQQFSGFEGEFEPFCDGCESISFNEEDCYILPLNNFPSLFSQAYANYEEAKAEIIEELGKKLLPFDIDDRLGELTGTIFG